MQRIDPTRIRSCQCFVGVHTLSDMQHELIMALLDGPKVPMPVTVIFTLSVHNFCTMQLQTQQNAPVNGHSLVDQLAFIQNRHVLCIETGSTFYEQSVYEGMAVFIYLPARSTG